MVNNRGSFGQAVLAGLIVAAGTEARMQNLSDRVVVAEREARVMEERWNDLKVELAKRGIPASDH